MERYVKINFGNSKRTYEYKQVDSFLLEGMMVWVPTKNGLKKGMIVWKGKSKNVELPVSQNKILKVKSRCYSVVSEKELVNYFSVLIEMYKDGTMSKEQLSIVFEGIVSNNHLDFGENFELREFFQKELPDICLFYVDEPGNESEKELEFWKCMREWEYKIKYGYFYKDRYKQEINQMFPLVESEVEDSDDYARVELEVERRVKNEIGEGGYRGYCHRYWSVKKRILAEYGIDWKTPQELNPGVVFD